MKTMTSIDKVVTLHKKEREYRKNPDWHGGGNQLFEVVFGATKKRIFEYQFYSYSNQFTINEKILVPAPFLFDFLPDIFTVF